MRVRERCAGASVAIALVVAACGTAREVRVGTGAAPAAASSAEQPADRAILRTAWIGVIVGDVRAAAARVEQSVQTLGGFVEHAATGAESAAELRVRVPATSLESFLNDVGALGEERERQVSARDVTEEVADLEAALANNRGLRDRLRALLARAKTVEEVLDVERELNRLQTQIDQEEGRLKRLRSQVELSSVTVQLERRTILGPLGYLFKGLGWVIGKLFVIQD